MTNGRVLLWAGTILMFIVSWIFTTMFWTRGPKEVAFLTGFLTVVLGLTLVSALGTLLWHGLLGIQNAGQHNIVQPQNQPQTQTTVAQPTQGNQNPGQGQQGQQTPNNQTVQPATQQTQTAGGAVQNQAQGGAQTMNRSLKVLDVVLSVGVILLIYFAGTSFGWWTPISQWGNTYVYPPDSFRGATPGGGRRFELTSSPDRPISGQVCTMTCRGRLMFDLNSNNPSLNPLAPERATSLESCRRMQMKLDQRARESCGGNRRPS